MNLCQNANGLQRWYLNALNLTTGATLTTPPPEIAYTVSAQYGPHQNFSASSQLQRPGLLLTYSQTSYARSVIAGFGTSVAEKSTQYQGWMFAFDAKNPSSVVNQEFANPYITQCFFNETATGSSPPCTPNPQS